MHLVCMDSPLSGLLLRILLGTVIHVTARAHGFLTLIPVQASTVTTTMIDLFYVDPLGLP